ncbi:tetratricopeptide repeat protein [Sphingomonas sp. ERG5]|uniref:tetratricopeptide repeat protein n=1 Tax=Sphingomonas sp. ERG5 TaxID=1381597 RepID=UPI000AA0D5EA|nr:tetratricopeptide repeat protein [Sphingomonas sp. ERG5]
MDQTSNSSRTGKLIMGLAAIVLAVSIGYASLRSAGEAAKPLGDPAPMTAGQPASLATLREQARASPDNVETWQALGAAAFEQQQFPEAAIAYERGTKIAPQRADLWSALGEARVMGSPTDPMPAAALSAFEKAIAIDAKDPRSRYFLAVKRDLSGDHQGAIDDWLALLRDTPPGASWESDLRRTIAQVGKINGIDVAGRLAAISPGDAHAGLTPGAGAGSAMPGPTAAEIRAAAALPPSEQNNMARGMVASLEAKLKANPANVDGWMMLMRSRMTLGEPASATAARKAAIAANPGAKARIESEASALGVPTG